MKGFCVSLVLATGFVLGPVGTAGAQLPRDLVAWSADAEIFPPRWTKAPYFATAKPIDEPLKKRAEAIVVRAMGKYPPQMLKKSIRRVYVVGELSFYKRQRWAGTSSADAIYIVVLPARRGYTDAFVEGTIHHEFSSVLANRYRRQFPQKEWLAANPANFRYLGSSSWERKQGQEGGAKAIDKGEKSTRLSARPDLLKQGFLTPYSRSSLENDFNVIAAHLWTNDTGFWKAVAKYPAIRKKCDLAIQFYGRVDSRLTKTFFRQLKR